MKITTCLLIIVLHTCFMCMAQETVYLWPIKGIEKGENILYKPQDYIGKELNCDNVIIKAPKGTDIFAPTDGQIVSFYYVYFDKLNSSTVFKIISGNFETDKKIILQQGWDTANDIKFLSLTVGIKTEEEKTIYISGLHPKKTFKTGERINKGDVIGTTGYFYKSINQSCIAISISEKGKSSDPMTPFGLKSTFKKEKKTEQFVLSAEGAKYDFELFINALKEGHPGLYDYINENEFEKHIITTVSSIKSPVLINDFERMLFVTMNKIRDGHLLMISPPYSNKDTYFPSISMGWLNDSLIVNRVMVTDKHYYGKKIIEVDGIQSDTLKQMLQSYFTRLEGYIESYLNFRLLTDGNLMYYKYAPYASRKSDVTLKFDNGEVKSFGGYKLEKRSCANYYPNWGDFYLINQYKENISLEKLSAQTAYIGLSSFDLNNIDMERIRCFIKSISDSSVQNLIIDLRNNYGGDEEIAAKIFSYIAQSSFQLSTYSKVNKQGNFNFFRYCLNYRSDSTNLFSDYTPINEKSGFYSYNKNQIFPDTLVNFTGKIYVLTNERSFSASTVFAGLVHKYQRGVIVGRETGSTYYQMNALKFADLRLPHSNIDIRIPLVKVVFDSLLDARIPWGRGVLPDYPVSLTLEELAFENGDSILNYTIQLIQKGYYRKEFLKEPIEVNEPINDNCLVRYVFFLSSLLFIIILTLLYYKKLRHGKKRHKPCNKNFNNAPANSAT